MEVKAAEAPIPGMPASTLSALQGKMDSQEQRLCFTAISGEDSFLVLTTLALYLTGQGQPVTRKPLRQLHRVQITAGNMLQIWMFEGYKVSTPFSVTFTDEENCGVWETALQHVVRRNFQLMTEADLIPSPEYYQCHFPLFKVNRKGVAQERTLVLSSASVYNVEVKAWPFETKDNLKAKWSFPVANVKALEQPNGPASLTIHLSEGAGSKSKEAYSFKALDETQCKDLIFELKRIYRWQTGQNLS